HAILHKVPDIVLDLWYLAAPVVLFGAPLGALFCRRSTTNTLLAFIFTIVTIEVISTIVLVELKPEKFLYYSIIFTAILIALLLLYFRSPYFHEHDEQTIKQNQ
ncbi:MAG: bacteriorhodopsin, partial [Lentisphaeria bacterium]